MTPTQQERRIQALYDDANVSRRNLCERVVHLEADMEELRCKLSSTFDERERMFRANVEKNCDLMRLMDENAKLRKLVRHMYECMGNIDADGNHECYSCEYENTDGKCDFGRRMRELGVEL